MTRATPIIVAGLLVIGIAVSAVRFMGGCGNTATRTRIAAKKTYDGPSTLPANATEWPKWRGPMGDGISREANLADTWPTGGPPMLWSADVGMGYASPVAARGRIYLFTLNDDIETLTCFDANSGNILWNQEGVSGRTRQYPGTRATPTIDGNDIFTLGGKGELTCRDVNSGAKKWSLNVLDETGTTALDWGTASTPLVSGNLLFMQTGQGGPVAIAVNRDSGTIAWKSEAQAIAGYASPILADVEGSQQLVIFGGKAVYGMDPNSGKTLWQHNWSTSWDVNASTPIYRDGKLFLTSGYDTGSVMLQLSRDSAPRELWRSKQAQSRFQPAILEGDAIYLNSEKAFMALGFSDGRLLFKDDANTLKLGLGGTFVRIPGDKIISLGERGQLSLATVTPAGVKLISGFPAVEGTEVWAMPLIYGGRVYVKGQQELVCFGVSNENSRSQISNSKSQTSPSVQNPN